MTNKSAIAAKVLFVCLGIAVLPGGATAASLSSYDGTWKVSRTGIGCTPTGLISVRVSGGRISGGYQGASGHHKVSGRISANGSFSFTGRSPRDTVSFSGKISGSSGRGSWSVAGRNCGGSLRIYR